MNTKELRKLSRKDLLEILLEQTKRIEELEIELEKVKFELNERKVSLKNVGSLAEASLVLSDIFKAADETASIYIQNIQKLAADAEKNTKKELRALKKKKLEEIDKECLKRISNAEKEIKKMQKENSKKVKEKNNQNKQKTNAEKIKRKH